jgi:hypothetical protein
MIPDRRGSNRGHTLSCWLIVASTLVMPVRGRSEDTPTWTPTTTRTLTTPSVTPTSGPASLRTPTSCRGDLPVVEPVISPSGALQQAIYFCGRIVNSSYMTACSEAGCAQDITMWGGCPPCPNPWNATCNRGTVPLLAGQTNHITVCQRNWTCPAGGCVTVDYDGNPLEIAQIGTPTVTATGTATNTRSPTASGTPTPTATATVLACADSYYQEAVLADAPLAYWRQEELSGSTAADSAGSHDGTYANVARYHASGAIATAQSNYAVNYNATNDSMKVTGFTTDISDWSLEFWMKSNNLTQTNRYVIDVGGSNQPAIIYGYVSKTLEVFGLGDGCRLAGTQISVTDTNWHHIVYVYKSEAPAHLYTYKDGVQGGADCTLSHSWAGSPWAFTFGDAGVGGANANVQLDEISFYPSQLSPARVMAHYIAAGVCPTATSLPTSSSTNTPTNTVTNTPTETAAATATATPSNTSTATPASTTTPISTDTATNTPSPTASHAPTATATGSPSPQPTPTLSCPPAPVDSCLSAAKGVLRVHDHGDDLHRKLLWRWLGGTTELLQSDFGDPVGTTTYAVCVYDYSAGTARLALEARVNPAATCGEVPCWRAASDKGWIYRDPAVVTDGFKTLVLQGGAAGKPRILLMAKGPELPTPDKFGAGRFFAQDPEVVVQMHASGIARCWTNSVAPGGTRRNDGDQFNARTP